VIESKVEKGVGGTASLLVTEGELKKGDYIVTEDGYGATRRMLNWQGQVVASVLPATPVTVSGFKTAPSFGVKFKAYQTEKEAKKALDLIDKKQVAESLDMSSQELLRMISKDRTQSGVRYVLRADVKGSLKSITDSIALLENEEVSARFISTGVGNLTEGDVQSASAAQAKIILFNADSPRDILRMASQKNIDIKRYSVIYELIDDIKKDMEDSLEPELVVEEIGKLKIQGVFRITKEAVIMGGEVTSGKITPGSKVRIYKKKELIGEAVVDNMQKGQEQVEQALKGDVCGMMLKTTTKLNIEVGDSLEAYTETMVKRKLSI
jgi:translation initiation factor IF-2